MAACCQHILDIYEKRRRRKGIAARAYAMPILSRAGQVSRSPAAQSPHACRRLPLRRHGAASAAAAIGDMAMRACGIFAQFRRHFDGPDAAHDFLLPSRRRYILKPTISRFIIMPKVVATAEAVSASGHREKSSSPLILIHGSRDTGASNAPLSPLRAPSQHSRYYRESLRR